jgi:hypothetical protein
LSGIFNTVEVHKNKQVEYKPLAIEYKAVLALLLGITALPLRPSVVNDQPRPATGGLSSHLRQRLCRSQVATEHGSGIDKPT